LLPRSQVACVTLGESLTSVTHAGPTLLGEWQLLLPDSARGFLPPKRGADPPRTPFCARGAMLQAVAQGVKFL